MSYTVYIHNSQTGRVEAMGNYDKMPLVIAEDGSKFINIPHLPPEELMKPAS